VIGIVPQVEVESLHGAWLRNSDNCLFYSIFFIVYIELVCCLRVGSENSDIFCNNNLVVGNLPQIPNNMVVSMEVDMNKRKIYWFVDGKQLNYCIKNVPESVYFAVCDIIVYKYFGI
jgi:hypothetical protein